MIDVAVGASGKKHRVTMDRDTMDRDTMDRDAMDRDAMERNAMEPQRSPRAAEEESGGNEDDQFRVLPLRLLAISAVTFFSVRCCLAPSRPGVARAINQTPPGLSR